MFDFSLLKNLVDSRIPYTLFEDEKTLEDSMRPYRVGNEIVTPIFGIFRQNPSTLTAFQSPLIAVVSAIVEIASPSEALQEVKQTMNAFVQTVNSTARKLESDGEVYNVIIQAETCSVGQKRRDVGWYNGEIFPVSTVVTFTIYERGVASNYDGLKMHIDGNLVPALQFNETRTASSEVYPDENAHGKVLVTQDTYGVTVSSPYINDTLGELVSDAVSHGSTNKAHAVDIEKNGVVNAYLMCVGTASTTAQPPLNIGFNLSLAELSPEVANFSDIWKSTIVDGEVASILEILPERCFVCWGDGDCDAFYNQTPTVHVYTDGASRHTVRFLDFDDNQKFGELKIGKTIFGKEIRISDGEYLNVASLPRQTLIETDSGDKLGIVNSRLCMTIAGVFVPVDFSDAVIEGGANVVSSFTSAMRGKVVFVHSELKRFFVYDRWTMGKDSFLSSADDVGAIIEQLLITQNGTYTAPEGVDGYSPITVNVPIPEGYIKPTGAKGITENGSHDVTEYASVNVNVESGDDVARSIINKTITAYSDNEITTVGAYAFNGCNKMTSVNLQNATYVGTSAFDGCSALTDVNLPNAKTVGGNAFQNCTSLTKLDLPKVTILNSYLVSGCSSLTELNIPNAESGKGFAIAGSKIEHLNLPKFAEPGSSVFRGATSLRTVYMPKLIKLEQYLFMGDTALETVTFPKVGYVAEQAMGSCSALTYVDLPICKRIDAKGFNNCSSLETLILRKSDAICILANVSAFTGTPIASGTGYIYVPKALLESYKVATNWSTYSNQIRAIEDYPEICGG